MYQLRFRTAKVHKIFPYTLYNRSFFIFFKESHLFTYPLKNMLSAKKQFALPYLYRSPDSPKPYSTQQNTIITHNEILYLY